MPQSNSHQAAIADLNSSFLELPFVLPPTEAADRWLMELEYVDIFEGKPEELEALADRAPSDSAAAFVRGAVAVRQNLMMFGPMATPLPTKGA